MDQPKKRGRQDTPGVPRTPEHERLAATATSAERQGLRHIAAKLRQFLGRADQ